MPRTKLNLHPSTLALVRYVASFNGEAVVTLSSVSVMDEKTVTSLASSTALMAAMKSKLCDYARKDRRPVLRDLARCGALSQISVHNPDQKRNCIQIDGIRYDISFLRGSADAPGVPTLPAPATIPQTPADVIRFIRERVELEEVVPAFMHGEQMEMD